MFINFTYSVPPSAGGSASSIKSKFENLALANDEENKKRAEEEKQRRKAREEAEKVAAQRREQVSRVQLVVTYNL